MDYEYGMNPRFCKAELPSLPVRLEVADLVMSDSNFIKLTLADGRTLILSMKSHIPQCHGIFFIQVDDGKQRGSVPCADRRIVASLAAFFDTVFAKSDGPRPSSGEIPILSREEAEEVWKRLDIPYYGTEMLDQLERAPRWPSCFI